MKFYLLTMAAGVLAMTSCATKHNPIEPVRPKITFGNPAKVHTVDSLRPTLEWKAPAEPGVTYDVIVYTGVPTVLYYERGKEVYYHEKIEGTQHIIQQALSPDTVYVWSVRVRKGTNTTAWITYDFVNLNARGRNLLWSFKTPKS